MASIGPVKRNAPRVLVIIPALNEEASIAGVIAEVRESIAGAEILVIDDGSTDATAANAKRAGVMVARLPYNLGVGGAMRVGYHYARDAGFDVAIQIDADGQHDPRSASQLIDGLADSDIVIGARFAGTESYAVRGPRRWAMRVLSAVLSRICRTRLTDTTSGYRAAGRRAIRLFATHFPAEYLGDTVEALVIAHRAGLTVSQVPVAMRERAAGTPSHNPLAAARFLVRASFALAFALVRPSEQYRSEVDAQ